MASTLGTLSGTKATPEFPPSGWLSSLKATGVAGVSEIELVGEDKIPTCCDTTSSW